MTGQRFHARHVYAEIKAATRALLGACGTLAQAAAATRVQPTKLSHYGSIHLADSFMPADVIADLEAAAGDPFVTRELARLAGHVLIELPDVGEDENFVSRLGSVSRDCGLVIGRVGEALGGDGIVSAREVRKLHLISLCDEAIEQLVLLRKASAAVLAHDEGKA